MSKPNTSETKRLFLNTANATSKEKLLSAFEGVEDNNADSTFHIGSADIVKNPASNIALSLIKCEYPNTLNQYNVHLGDDSPSIVVFSNESDNYANVQFTENTLDLTSATVYAPFRLCSNQQDLITLINTALKNANGGVDPTSLIVVDPYTNVLKSTGEFDIIFFNNIFNDPTFFAYDPDSKNIYRDLGLNTDTTLAFTYLEPLVAPTVPKHYFLNVKFDDLDTNLYVDHPGASGAYRLLPIGIAFDSAYATIIQDSTSAAFRRDANGYTYLWIRYPGAQGRYVFWMLKSNGPAGVFFQAPDFDWVGVTLAQLQAVPGSAETFFGDLGLHPGVPPNIGGGTLEWTYGGDIGTATIKDPTGTYPGAGADAINRTLAYPVGLNPSPLFLKTNLNFDSFATMNKGMKNIIAMIPIEATVLSSKNVTTLLPVTEDVVPISIANPTHTLTVANHPYTPALNGDYISVGSLYRDPSPPRYFKESVDHHLFRMDTATNTYLLFSYGIHTNATWYIGIYPLLSTTVDYLNNNHTTLGQTSQHSIGLNWNAFTGGGIGHWPSPAYTPSHTLTGVYSE